jgi:hypothetical protein
VGFCDSFPDKARFYDVEGKSYVKIDFVESFASPSVADHFWENRGDREITFKVLFLERTLYVTGKLFIRWHDKASAKRSLARCVNEVLFHGEVAQLSEPDWTNRDR